MVSDEARGVSREGADDEGTAWTSSCRQWGVQKNLKQGMTSPEIILVALERIHLRQTKTGRSKIS